MHIRPATPADWREIWTIVEPVVRAGETYALDRDLTEADAHLYWMGGDKEVFVAIDDEDGDMLGSYWIHPNQYGGGRHICNCGYMTRPTERGQGVGHALCAHSIEHARSRGYRGMQFNFVIATNAPAVHTWLEMGMEIKARMPGVFHHPTNGYVDAFVMFQSLVD